VLFLTIIAY